MDKIIDFFKELKERASNPLFSSFILAWIIFNWKIPIALFFYNNQELVVDGYYSYIDLILKNTIPANTLWKPLAVSVIYTFGYPIIRTYILAFNTKIKTWSTTWNLALAKESKISISKYIQLREIYSDRTQLLEEVLEKESTFLKQYEEEKNKALELSNSKNVLFNELEKWKSANNITLLDGEWEVSYSSSEKKNIYRVRIRHNLLEFIDNPPSNKNNQIHIKAFYKNPYQSTLLLTTLVEDIDRNRSFHFIRLDILDDMKILRGVEDDIYPIEFRRYL